MVFPGVSRHAEFDFDIHFARGSLYIWCSTHMVNFTGVTQAYHGVGSVSGLVILAFTKLGH